MATVTFVSHDGESHEATLEEGKSLMQVASTMTCLGLMVTVVVRRHAVPAT